MATIQVMAGMKVTITSSVEAAARQRFRVFRQVGSDPQYVLLDTISGGGSVVYGAWNVRSVYVIHCEAWWDYAHPTDWMPSREQVSTADAGNTTIIRCEDYWSTDNDWNDLVVRVALTPSAQVQDAANGTNPYAAVQA